ncbi:hypothetical protein QD712_25550 [Streptomyces acidiscabies]|uniref:hypothetical protein n=1 Tax=Streptomyces acidiscabies TaxID=42234 RepID=UPI0030CC87A0
MSLHRVRFLVCEKPLCTARYFPGDGTAPGTVLRQHARAAGWREHEGRDYCPDHLPWPGFTAWATATPAAPSRPGRWPKQARVDHKTVGEALRAQPGTWLTVGEYRNRGSADSVAHWIRVGRGGGTYQIGRWYQPVGAYETRTTLTDDGTLLEARYLGETGGAR